MKKLDFISKKLSYLLENFESLTDEEIRQSHYLVLYKTRKQINECLEMIETSNKQNEQIIKENLHLQEVIDHYEQFIKVSGLTKRFEFYSQKKDVI